MKERLFLHSSANLCETSAPSAVRIRSFRQSTHRDPSKADNNRNSFLAAETAEDRRGPQRTAEDRKRTAGGLQEDCKRNFTGLHRN